MHDDTNLTNGPQSALRRATNGDAAAFWELMEPLERTIFSVAYSVLKDRERASDVVHDVYLRAFSTLGNLRSPEKMNSWIFSMARNIAREHLRRDVRQEKIASAAPERSVISVPDMMIREEEFELLETSMAQLPEAHRVVLGLKYMNNMSCREIADTLAIGVEAAKSRLFEARKALRARMRQAENPKAAARSAARDTR